MQSINVSLGPCGSLAISTKFENSLDLKSFEAKSKTVFEDIKKISTSTCLGEIKKDLESLNIVHDEWFYESSLIESKYFDETLEKIDSILAKFSPPI